MATTNFNIRHRPNRIGFLVRSNNMADLEEAAARCNLLWGGIRNPIIAVASETDAIADDLVRRFQVDVLLPVVKTADIEKFMGRHHLRRHPRLSGSDLFVQDWRTKKHRVTYLDVIHAVDKYWVEEFKHAGADRKSPFRLVTWDGNDPLRHLLSLRFGGYPSGVSLRDDFQAAFLNGLRASEVCIDDGKEIPTELIECVTPVTLTATELAPYGALTACGRAASILAIRATWRT